MGAGTDLSHIYSNRVGIGGLILTFARVQQPTMLFYFQIKGF